MLKIRLTRTGKRKQPSYRIIVTERRSKRDGKFAANLGYYTPTSNPAILKLDVNEYEEWLKKGAQPTETVAYLRTKAKDNEIVTIEKAKKDKKFKEKRNEAAA